MFTEVKKIEGNIDGPVSMLIAGVHGNERGGILALSELLPSLTIEAGVLYVGFGNPIAIERNVRFVDTDLNRLFRRDADLNRDQLKSYEYERAQYLKTYFDKADVLLDVHGSSIPNTRSFAVCEPNAVELVRFLPTETVVTGFDQAEPGGTDYYMNQKGSIGICLESGYLNGAQSLTKAKESMLRFLAIRGHLRGDVEPVRQDMFHVYQKYYSQTDEFLLAKPFENFEYVEAGQVIGEDGGARVVAPKPSNILFAHECHKRGSEAFLLSEKTNSLA